ncbi:MAG TPA: hypothetical protein VJC21_05005 [Candidatus Nanoarchaeia archaeon]|nr:hypothetical protein [Candidatus Nanoarchaeia archaeon]
MTPKETLRSVLAAFEQENIRYCLLRNYEFLLDENLPPESLDTAIAKDDLPKADRILRHYGFEQRTQQFSLVHKAYFKVLGLQKASFDMQVGGVHWNDMQYLGEEIFSRRKKMAFFSTLSDNDYYVMLIAHSILGKRFFKPKYQQILKTLHADTEKVSAELSKIFTQNMARQLVEKAAAGNFMMIKPFLPLSTFVCKKPKRMGTLAALSWRWLLQKKNPFRIAPLISIVGPDGAGKSTLVQVLQEALEKTGRKAAIIYVGRGRQNILPFSSIGRAYKRAEKRRDGQTEKRGESRKKKRPLLRSLLYNLMAPVFALDLYLRSLFTILPLRLKKTIVITDRYCSDILLMKHVPLAVKKLLVKIFPKPTLSILLWNTPEALHARREEESVAELQRQMEIFNTQQYSLRVRTQQGKADTERVTTFVLTELMKRWW